MNNYKKCNMLVSFADITNFARNSQRMSLQQLAEFVTEFYSIVDDTIESNGGQVLKFIGDAALIVFPEDKVVIGVKSLLTCKQRVDKWLNEQKSDSQLVVKAHFGELMHGSFRVMDRAVIDVIGESVNVSALLKSNGFAMTPQVFRKLDSNTRKLFKKHTPPVTYIPTTEYHKD